MLKTCDWIWSLWVLYMFLCCKTRVARALIEFLKRIRAASMRFLLWSAPQEAFWVAPYISTTRHRAFWPSSLLFRFYYQPSTSKSEQEMHYIYSSDRRLDGGFRHFGFTWTEEPVHFANYRFKRMVICKKEALGSSLRVASLLLERRRTQFLAKSGSPYVPPPETWTRVEWFLIKNIVISLPHCRKYKLGVFGIKLMNQTEPPANEALKRFWR